MVAEINATAHNRRRAKLRSCEILQTDSSTSDHQPRQRPRYRSTKRPRRITTHHIDHVAVPDSFVTSAAVMRCSGHARLEVMRWHCGYHADRSSTTRRWPTNTLIIAQLLSLVPVNWPCEQSLTFRQHLDPERLHSNRCCDWYAAFIRISALPCPPILRA